MSIVSGIVVFALAWFIVLLVMLPFYEKTQAESGEVVPGTHEGAPADFKAKKVAIRVTLATAVIWLIIFGVVTSGWISLSDFDWTKRFHPQADETGE